ncbi:hypothetical protein Desdi_0378 [Desulfitobacterium dichloroeliminans LMG P-21439]|uniref:Uncharacterized protein n=1 Tax=Desulfitobacterium dichloroeliminans (strain LMG P-21439 / DCA1) TaxID=871963 RepID=L0F246_DESDL|nr:hypothetical protein [Desulfitobacterium dichloroeliminans]AGA67924.1 hypothetical protein Desdi_0378 [Desulfitobacterium dichloroeliminans LMG P-21439]
MKKNLVPMLIILLIVLQAMSLSRLGDLQNDLRNTQNQLASIEMNQSREMSTIYTNIDSMLKRQSSILDSYDYSLGKLDRDKLTVPITFKITPKETKADTHVTLYMSDESVDMSKNGTTFTGTLGADLFEPIEAKVVLVDSGIERTEKMEIAENLRGNVLPDVYARFERRGETKIYSKQPNQLSGEYNFEGNLSLDVKPVRNNTIEKARLIIDVDGKVVSEEPLNTGGQWTEIDKQWILSAGETLTMSVIATDTLGLNHKKILDKFALDENAEPAHEDEWMWMDEVIITDQAGKVLYAPQYGKVN